MRYLHDVNSDLRGQGWRLGKVSTIGKNKHRLLYQKGDNITEVDFSATTIEMANQQLIPCSEVKYSTLIHIQPKGKLCLNNTFLFNKS